MTLKPILTLAAAAAVAGLAAPASAETIFGLTTQNGLVTFDDSSPTVLTDAGFVSGLENNEVLLGIDFRPQTGELFAVGSMSNLYTIDTTSFEATLVGDGFAPPRLAGSAFGFDFNPQIDLIRLVSETNDNRVLDPDTGEYFGTPEKVDVFYVPGDANAGEDPNIVGNAYTNSFTRPGNPSAANPDATGTQLFAIDSDLGILATQANNAGELETVGSLGLSGAITNELGFDISGMTGTAYAAIQNGPNSGLYTIDLSSGTATLVGTIGSGDLIRDISVVIPEPTSLGLVAAAGLGLLRRRGA